MATGATGTISKIRDNLKTLLANSGTFQTWVSAISAAAAKAHIFMVQPDPTATDVRPYAVIGHGEEGAPHHKDDGTVEGTLFMFFEDDITEVDDESDENVFTNKIGAIISEMQVLVAGGGYLGVTDFDPEFCGRTEEGEEEAEGPCYQAKYSVSYWGI